VSSANLRYGLPNHHPSVFNDEYINFLLVALRGGGSWSATARQTSNVLLAIFEVFHPTSHIVGTHAGISIGMRKSSEDVCSKIVLRYEESNHSVLAKGYIAYSHFVALDCGYTYNLDLCFRLMETYTALCSITRGPVVLIKHT
jgi:hypothetical protein